MPTKSRIVGTCLFGDINKSKCLPGLKSNFFYYYLSYFFYGYVFFPVGNVAKLFFIHILITGF